MNTCDNTIAITIKDVVFDTAKSNVHFWYDTKTEKISEFRIMSHFHYTKQSTKEWIDDCSYGQCYYYPKTDEEWMELADCIIKKQDWTWKKACSNDREEKLLDGVTKTKILKHMAKV